MATPGNEEGGLVRWAGALAGRGHEPERRALPGWGSVLKFLPSNARRSGSIVAFALGLCVMLLTGCASTGTSDTTPMVESLHLFCVPQAVNLDGEPGPDGFAVRLFARGPKNSKGVAFPNGVLEIAMFEGLVSGTSGSTNKPLRTWEFAGSELKKHAGESAVGTGYRFTLRWTDARPAGSRISIVARHLPPTGPAITSAPSSISIGAN